MASTNTPDTHPMQRETVLRQTEDPRILIVEDLDFMARLLLTQLVAAGYRRVTIVHDGAEAIEALIRERFDVIITDWQMSPVGGRELTHNLRRAVDSPSPGIAIIAMSGFVDMNAIEEMLLAGVDEIVSKPVALDELIRRIRSALGEPRLFVRTKTYFGPDRRRRADPSWGDKTERRTAAPRLEARPKSKRER